MRARYIRTGQEYAIKILDKNHLIRKDKMLVALAEKNVLVKLGVGHPGIIHLHWTFQDEWSLCQYHVPLYMLCVCIRSRSLTGHTWQSVIHTATLALVIGCMDQAYIRFSHEPTSLMSYQSLSLTWRPMGRCNPAYHALAP
jgi:hypothetical protein